METEQNNEIAFLDILIKRTEEGQIETKVYRKGTHRDRYLNFNSFHHKSQNISVIDALAYRAFKICSQNYLQDKLYYIKRTLQENAFPIEFINRRIERMELKFRNPNEALDRASNVITEIANPLNNN